MHRDRRGDGTAGSCVHAWVCGLPGAGPLPTLPPASLRPSRMPVAHGTMPDVGRYFSPPVHIFITPFMNQECNSSFRFVLENKQKIHEYGHDNIKFSFYDIGQCSLVFTFILPVCYNPVYFTIRIHYSKFRTRSNFE